MSVTFTAAIDLETVYAGSFSVTSLNGGRADFPNRATATAHMNRVLDGAAVLPGDTDPEDSRAYMVVTITPTALVEAAAANPLADGINMSNVNARTVLSALQLDNEEGELCGTVTVEEFRAAIALASVIATEDLGVPAHEVPNQGVGRFVDCGRRAGYVQDRLVNLERLAEYAANQGITEISWA